MSPVIELSEPTFARLQKHATPLVDTPETTIAKLLDLIEGAAVAGASKGPSPLDSFNPPDLTHTKIIAATIDGKSLPAAQRYWNAIFLVAAHAAVAKLPKGKDIAELILANKVEGVKEDSGYKFQEKLGLSIQGQDSNSAWKSIAYLARESGVAVDVEFAWLENPQAARPGQSGRLKINA